MYNKIFELHAELFKALSQPKRLEIVHLLRNQTLSVTQIQEMLDLSQANLSQHLMMLRAAKVVTTHKVGREVHYSLTHPELIGACDQFREILVETHKDNGLKEADSFRMMEYLPLVSDPVCGMRISPKTAGASTLFNDQTYYFCASGCRVAFTKRPEHYV